MSSYRNEKDMKPQTLPQPKESASFVAEAKRKKREIALDDALKNTFPASDPVSAEQPGGNQNWNDKGEQDGTPA